MQKACHGNSELDHWKKSSPAVCLVIDTSRTSSSSIFYESCEFVSTAHRIWMLETFSSTSSVTQIQCSETGTPAILLMKDLGCASSARLFLMSKINYCYSSRSDLC